MNASAQLISKLPLKEMDGALLFPAVLTEAVRTGHDVLLVSSAMNLASYLHRKQTRANRGDLPRTCYIEHPLRGTMRAYRYGVTDIDIIIGEILHDTVEDNPLEFASQIAGRPTDDEARARVTAFATVQKMYGPGVEAIVRGMTNDISVPGLSRAEKHTNYVKHVVIAIEDPRVAIAKFIDFVDNAVGLHHNLQGAGTGMVVRLATKYTPLVPIFFERLQRDDVRALVSADGHTDMMTHLELGATRLASLLRNHAIAEAEGVTQRAHAAERAASRVHQSTPQTSPHYYQGLRAHHEAAESYTSAVKIQAGLERDRDRAELSNL